MRSRSATHSNAVGHIKRWKVNIEENRTKLKQMPIEVIADFVKGDPRIKTLLDT